MRCPTSHSKDGEEHGLNLVTSAGPVVDVQSLSHVWLVIPRTARLPCPSLSPRACSNSCLLIQWCHSSITFEVTHFSFALNLQGKSDYFSNEMALHNTGGQSIRVSASTSVFPINIQGWFPLGLIGLISLLKVLSRVFSSSTIRKHQFFGAQPSLWSNSHICTWLLEKP